MSCKRLFLLTAILILVSCFSGCGGSSKSPSVAVTASVTTVDGTDTVTLIATVSNDKSTSGTADGVSWSVSGGGTLSNTTTTSATYTAPAATASAQTVTVTATSVADTTKTGSVTLTVAAKPAITAPTSTQLTGAVGSVYSLQLAGTGGITPYTWTLTAGTLPTGWTLTTGGLLSGPAPVAGQAGSIVLTFKMTDAGTPTAFSDSLQVTVTINPAPAISFTGAMPATATYNSAYTGSAAASGGAGTLTYSLASGSGPLPGGLSLNTSTGALTGTPTATGGFPFTIKAADAYGDSATQAYTITVNKATSALAFTAIPAKTYGDAAFTANATSASTGAVTYSVTSGPATINSSTGSVTITGAGAVVLGASQAATANYTAATATTSFTVNKATATINVTPYTVTYDGNAHTATATATGVGGVNLPASDFTLTSTTHTNAGTYSSDAWSFADPSGNYNDASGTVSDKINQAAATVNVTPYTVTYDGTAHTAAATATGVGGAALPASDFTLSGTAHTNAGTYASDAWSFTDAAGNYASQNGTVSDTIDKAAATVNVTPYTVTYDATAHTAAATATGVGGAALPASDFTLTGTAHTNAGTFGNDQWSFADQNYVSQSGTISDKINQATATIIVNPYTVTYDGKAHTAAAAATGVGGVNLIADLDVTGTTHTNTASYPNDPWIFTDPLGNYVSANGTVADTINISSATIVMANVADHTYGDANFTVTANATSDGAVTFYVSNGPATVNPSTGVVTLTGAGHVSMRASVAATSNYTAATSADINFNVSPANATIHVTPYTVTYDGAAHTASATATGVGGVSLSPTDFTMGGTTHTNAGTYTNDAWSFSDPSGNYNSANGTVTDTINGMSPALSFVAIPTKVYGTPPAGDAPFTVSTNTSSSGTVTYTVTSGPATVSGSTVTLTGPGTVNLHASQAAKDNYAAATADTSFAVNPTLSITTSTLPDAAVNSAYSNTLAATGGSGTLTWSTDIAGATSLSNNHLALSSTGVVSGTPTSAGSASFTATVTDSAGHTQSQSFTIALTTQLTITTASLPPATAGVAYSQALVAVGGSGNSLNYNWSWSATSGTLPAGLSLGTTGIISGIPTSAGTYNITLSLQDAPTSEIVTRQVTLTVYGPLALPDPSTNPLTTPATINQSYYGGINATGGANGVSYSFTVQIGGATTTVPTTDTPVTLTNGNGLTAQNSGGSTLFISGTPTTAGSLTLLVTVSDSASDTPASQSYTINIVNPAAGYNVSGTVSYTGTKTGWIYLQLKNNNCDNCGQPGIAIPAKGTYTIKGVPAGTYALKAFMDPFYYGAQNASDPTGSVSNITVSSGDVSGANVTLTNPGTIAFSTTPTISVAGTFATGAFVQLGNLPTDSNGVEKASSYNVRWSTDSFSTYTEKSFPAIGGSNSPYIVSGLTNGLSYSFMVQAVAGSSTSGWSAATTAVTIANTPASGNNAVSGTVTFPGTAVGPLYVGFYDQSTGKVYAKAFATPVSPQAYSMYVPTGSNYFFFGIVDNNNSGVLSGAGQVSNTNQQNSASVAITGTTTNENLTLPTNTAGTAPKNSVARVTTQHNQQINAGGTYDNYNINFRVDGLYKLPVAVELATKPAASAVATPSDWATGAFNSNVDEFQFEPNLNGGTPQVGDAYSLLVTYSDGTSETLNVSVGAVLNALATLNTPAALATGVSATPSFNWTDPANASNYTYQFQLQDSSNSTIWKIPSDHSGSNGFSNSITSITWGSDPTGNSITPSVSSLDSLATYYWSIQATDASGNSAQEQVSFETGESSLTLPDNSTPGSALINQAYSQSLNASGGSGSGYVFTVNSSAGTTNAGTTTWSLGNGLTASTSTGSNSQLTVSGTPTSATTVTFSVSVTDSQSHTAGPVTYTISVINGPNGAHNSYLNGTYVCKTDSFVDSTGARFTTLSSVQFAGSGTLTGVFDMNGRNTATALTGTTTGTYSVGSDNNGMATIISTIAGISGTTSSQWAIALNNLAGPTATEFRMAEADDVGASASGKHGTADCYLATTGAFAASTINGKSFAFGIQGENGDLPVAYVGRFSAASGSLTNGYMDGMRLGQTGNKNASFTGSYGTVSGTTGRFTLSLTTAKGTNNLAAYIINANRIFLLTTDAAGANSMMAGEMRKQQQSSYAGANLNSNFVLYNRGFEYSGSSVSGYDSGIMQATGNGAGSITINRSYQSSNGTYHPDEENGVTLAVTFDSSNPGRAYFSVDTDTIYWYFFDNNSAFHLNLGTNYLETGWMETQTQSTFTNAALAGTYLFGRLAPISAEKDDQVGVVSVSSGGALTGLISSAGMGNFGWDQSQSIGSLTWLSSTYGTFSIPEGGTEVGACAVISSEKIICLDGSSDSATMEIMEK